MPNHPKKRGWITSDFDSDPPNGHNDYHPHNNINCWFYSPRINHERGKPDHNNQKKNYTRINHI